MLTRLNLIDHSLTAALGLFALLPLPMARRLANGLGNLTWALRAEAARITHINLARCFPQLERAERSVLARASLRHSWMLALEAGALRHWPDRRLQRLLVQETGRELIGKQLAQGRGLLVLAPHFGNWEFLCYVLGRLSPVALYDPPRLPALEKALLHSRQRFGLRLAPANQQGLRKAYVALKQGRVACLLPDQAPAPSAGVFAPFFGQPALTMTLAHRLLEKTGASVLMSSTRRVRGGFAVRHELLEGWDLGDGPTAFAATLNRSIEALVRLDPAQYQWEYKRFKRQPPGCPNPYPKRKKNPASAAKRNG